MIRKPVRTALAVPLALALATATVTVPAATAADPTLRINEIVTQETDWVELYNPTSGDIDISGWTAVDGGKKSVAIVFPQGTVVPAGGYYVFDTEGPGNTPDKSEGFGLGKDDSMTIRDASGAKIDSFSWKSHPKILGNVNTSWSRIGDGADNWEVSLRATPRATNEKLRVVINELVSKSDDKAKDWVELANPTASDVSIEGWTAKDDGKKGPITFPAGTVVPAGGYYVFETEGSNTPDGTEGFGLGDGDEVTIKDKDGNLVDYFKYATHATADGKNTSWGRLPDMTGTFSITGETTRGAANKPQPATVPTDPTDPTDPTVPFDPQTATPVVSPVVINEVESNGDPVADWVELHNTGDTAVDISGWLVLDNNDTHAPIVIPDGTTIEPKGYYRFYTEGSGAIAGQEGFGLGGNDSVRVFTPKNEIVDTVTWSSHATDTLGRLPNGTGEFEQTKATPEAANEKYEPAKPLETDPWPSDPQEIKNLDLGGDFGGEDMSGVDFDENGRAWVVNNGTSNLYALDYDEATDTYTVAGTWRLRYKDGSGDPDAEGIAVGPDGALYVATERDNANKEVSRPSVLRFEVPTTAGGDLNATEEWNLATHTGALGPNGGLEAISYIPGVGSNLYAVGVEQTGEVLFVELGANGASSLKQRYKAPFKGVMALDYDLRAGQLRALCDEVCEGQSVLLEYDGTQFVPASEKVQARPAAMDNFANEGYATYTKTGECVDGKKTTTTRYLWTDDGAKNGTSLRSATTRTDEVCESPAEPSKPSESSKPSTTPRKPRPDSPARPWVPAPSNPTPTTTAKHTTAAVTTTQASPTPATSTTPAPETTTPQLTTAVAKPSDRCIATLAGWGIAAALLIPAALLAQLGIPLVGNLMAPVNELFAQVNAAAQAQLGFLNPALADQAARLGAIAAQAGPLLAALALGITAVATIADNCGSTTQTTVATTERLIGSSSR